MVAIGPGEVVGSIPLREHFEKIAGQGGQLEEVYSTDYTYITVY